MNGVKKQAETMDLQLFAVESTPGGAAQEAGTESATESSSSNEPLGVNAERDREDVRQMSSFLRDFQKKSAAEPGTGQQEPGAGAQPDNPTGGEADRKAPDTTPEPGSVPAVQPPGDALQAIKLPDGREYTIEQILEMEKGHMMQSDYTRKTQALAEDRRKLEEQRLVNERAFKLLQDYERDPVGTAIRLQEEAEAKGIFEPKDPEVLALEERQLALEKKELEIQRKEQEMQQQAVYKDLENRVVALETKHGNEFDRQKVIQFMIDEKIYSPEVAWNAIRAEQLEARTQKQVDELKNQLKKSKEEAVNEYIKAKTSKQNAPLPVGAGGSTGSPPIQVNRPRTLDDAKRAALARTYTPN